MNNIWPGLIVAVVLVLFGASLMVSHVRTWRRQRNSLRLDENERAFFEKRYRRRMRVSGTFVVLGILIGAGDALLPLQIHKPPPLQRGGIDSGALVIGLYWIGVLVLTGWVVVQGFGDLWSTATHADAELTRIREKRRELERQIVEFKHRNLGDREFDGRAEL